MSASKTLASAGKDERAELDKYVKFFCLKTIELLHCSRQPNLGPVLQTVDPNSRPWFNIQTPEAPEVGKRAKSALDRQLPSPQQSLIIQVTLTTSPFSKTVIEAWRISRSEDCDHNAKLITGVYSKLSLLLKSLICMSRCTPAYKLCRENSNVKVDTEFYFGEVSPTLLNDECEKPRRLGSVSTPFGSVAVTVLCRTYKQIERILSAVKTHSEVGKENVDAAPSGRVVNESFESNAPRKVLEFPITPAFARQPAVNEKDLLQDLSVDQFLQQLDRNPFKATEQEDPSDGLMHGGNEENEPNKLLEASFRHSNHLDSPFKSVGRKRSKDSLGRPGSVELNQPAFVSSGESLSSGQQKTDSSGSSAEVVESDVSQFFRVVQQASSLRSNEPHEGHVISHNMQLGEYVTSFSEIGNELKRLASNTSDSFLGSAN